MKTLILHHPDLHILLVFWFIIGILPLLLKTLKKQLLLFTILCEM